MTGLFFQTIILALALSVIAAPSGNQINGCKDVHIIKARGTGVSPMDDGLKNVASMVQSNLGSETSDQVELDYLATDTQDGGEPYPKSIQDGQNALIKDIESYATMCSSSKIVLIGFSQGAQVIGNVLCGATNEGLGIKPTMPLDQKYRSAIFASVWFGDPAHNPNQPWNVGGGSNGTHGIGAYSRSNSDQCNYMKGKLASYCSTGDRFCDSQGDVPPGKDPTIIHRMEVGTWKQQAASFITALVK